LIDVKKKRNEKAEQAKRYMYRRRWRVEADAEVETAEAETAEVETTKAETTEAETTETAEVETAEAETAHVPRKYNTPPSCWAPSSPQEPKKDTWVKPYSKRPRTRKQPRTLKDKNQRSNNKEKYNVQDQDEDHTTVTCSTRKNLTVCFDVRKGKKVYSQWLSEPQNQRSSKILPRSALPDPSDPLLLHHIEIPLSFVSAFMISV
jgi:hypothetical protein